MKENADEGNLICKRLSVNMTHILLILIRVCFKFIRTKIKRNPGHINNMQTALD